MQKIQPPWYQIPPLDFVSENLIGRELRDERILDFTLLPQRVVPTPELLTRANGLRDSTRSGFVVPTPAGVQLNAPASGAPGLSPPAAVPPPFQPPGQVQPQIITLPPTNAVAP